MRLYLATSLALMACGDDPCPEGRYFETRQGIPVCVDEAHELRDYISRGLASDMVDIVQSQPRLQGLGAPAMLHWGQELSGGDVDGQYAFGHIFLTSHYACGFRWAGHEWGHFYLDATTGDPDSGHEHQEIFGTDHGQLAGDVWFALIDYCTQHGLL
jgi:hypothetical protein